MAPFAGLEKAGIQHSSRRQLLLTYRTDTGLTAALQAAAGMRGGIAVGTAEDFHHSIRFSGVQHAFHLLLFLQNCSTERAAMEARAIGFFRGFGFGVYAGTKLLLALV